MYLLKTRDGPTFIGKDKADLVYAMRQNAWASDLTLPEYMQWVADRILEMTNRRIRTQGPDDFIDDLEMIGMVEVGKPD